MKKFFLIALVILIIICTFAGCGNSVKKDLEKFNNIEMVEVNKNYRKMKYAVSKWDDFSTNDEFVKSLENEIIPNINKSIELADKIKPKTDEVKALKDKYQEMLATYKDGYEKMLSDFKNNNESLAEESINTISKAIDLFNEYEISLGKLEKKYNINKTTRNQ